MDYKKFMEGSKEEYQAFFDKKLKKYGVSSPEELSDDEKKKFYNEIDKEWNADHEDGKDGKVKKEWKKSGETNRRCSGGDGRRTKNKVKTEEDEDEEEVEEKKEMMYSEKQINKACKAIKMSPAEVGDFYAALDGK